MPQVEGTFEADGKQGGFLRTPSIGYRARPGDPFVSPALVRTNGLRGGEAIVAAVADRASGRGGHPAVGDVTTVNGRSPDDWRDVRPITELTAVDPTRQIRFEIPGGPMTMRVIDLLTPIGFGQRGLIVAPPRTGKTVLLEQMADGLAHNFPEAYMLVLLVDERPEEVTEMRRHVHGEVVASSNDYSPEQHVRLARLMIEKVKRMAESGTDVVVLLDSLTRLGRAFNNLIRGGGRIMSGGLDSRALQEPKSIFGAARAIEEGGTLTIMASALIETGSRMDEVIFNEFKGTGNMEIMLCRELANRRVWPAIDLQRSGTRKDHLLLNAKEFEVANALRRRLCDREPLRAMESLLEALGRTKSNAEFVEGFSDRAFR
jgi:transcription termination factor Rho